jgi:hypothetical protein
MRTQVLINALTVHVDFQVSVTATRQARGVTSDLLITRVQFREALGVESALPVTCGNAAA